MYNNSQAILENVTDLDIDDFNDVEELEDFLDELEDDYDTDDYNDEDLSERKRRRRRRRGRRSSLPSNRLRSQSSSNQSALKMAINKNSEAIKKVDTKVNAVNAKVGALGDEQRRQMMVLKKDRISRKQEMADLKSKLQLFAILPLLTGGTGSGNSSLGLLLPLLILGDLGGSGSKSGGTDMSSLILVLALSGGLGKS